MTIAQLWECVETGSRQLQAAKTGIDIAQQGVAHARAQRLPDIDLSLSASYIGNALLADRDMGNMHGLHSPHLGNSLAIEAQQVIYSGGALTAAINMAETGRRQAATGVALNRQQARFMALGQYLDLYRTDNRIRVYEHNIALTRQLIDEIRQRYQQGMALQNDITRYELQLEQLQLRLRQARDARAVTNHQLCNTLGLAQATTLQPDTTLTAKVCQREGEAYWQQRSATLSPLIEQGQLGIDMARHREQLAKSDLRPKVAMVAANNLNGPITFELPPINKNLNVWYIGIGVKYSLGALYKSRRRVAQAQAETLKAQQDLAVTQQSIDNRVNQAYTDYLQTYAELETQQKSVQLACQNYDVVSARYAGQLALVTDMIDASNVKLSAELQEADARIAIVYAYYRMKYIAGDI